MRILVLLAAAAACTGVPRPQDSRLHFQEVRGAGETELGDMIQELGLDVSVELHKPGTIVISPLSISSLLSVLMMGSGGQSNLELRRALHLPDNINEDDIHSSFHRLVKRLSRNDTSITLNVANGLFLQMGAGIINGFTMKAHALYNSVVTTLDFRKSSGRATNAINQWVKASTNGMIPELFTQTLSSETTFVAVNTVYFNGKWHTPFSPNFTTDRDFETGTETIKVPMMSGTIPVDYINIPELDAHMAALPYKGGRQAMYIILPQGPVTADLEPLELEFDAQRLNAFISNMTTLDMRVWLPRMRLSFKTSLRDTLKSLHVGSIFSPFCANFSRLTSESVYVDDVVHETVIEITEKGTKAAAATGSDLNRAGSSSTFIVNRPAILFIRDRESGVPLFWGKLVRPEPLRS